VEITFCARGSVQFQNNANFGVGKLDNTQNILNFQPVVPLHLNPVQMPNWRIPVNAN
jgi:hypothetical protein